MEQARVPSQAPGGRGGEGREGKGRGGKGRGGRTVGGGEGRGGAGEGWGRGGILVEEAEYKEETEGTGNSGRGARRRVVWREGNRKGNGILYRDVH